MPSPQRSYGQQLRSCRRSSAEAPVQDLPNPCRPAKLYRRAPKPQSGAAASLAPCPGTYLGPQRQEQGEDGARRRGCPPGRTHAAAAAALPARPPAGPPPLAPGRDGTGRARREEEEKKEREEEASPLLSLLLLPPPPRSNIPRRTRAGQRRFSSAFNSAPLFNAKQPGLLLSALFSRLPSFLSLFFSLSPFSFFFFLFYYGDYYPSPFISCGGAPRPPETHTRTHTHSHTRTCSTRTAPQPPARLGAPPPLRFI